MTEVANYDWRTACKKRGTIVESKTSSNEIINDRHSTIGTRHVKKYNLIE